MNRLTIIEEPPGGTKEHHKARWWRTHVARLSIPQLSELTGYGIRSIYDMENGHNSVGRKIDQYVWRRYKCACAGVHHTLQREPFNWACK